jgi:ABC-type phosphate/phosphonate transport system substrate-binding protein
MLRPALYCIAVILGLIAHLPAGAAEKPAASQPKSVPDYTITVIPYYSPEKIWTKFSPFIEHLRKETGLPWELKLYPTHEALLDGLCKGDVSFALLGPVPLGRVIDRCNAGIAAVALGKDGTPFYRSVILTTDPAVQGLADLKGKKFGLFKGSTAAHIFPLKMLHDAGVADPEIVPAFYDSQDHIMNALLQHAISGAGVKDILYQKFKTEPLRVLKTSEPLPGFAFAVAPNLSEAVRRRFVDALIRLDPLKDPRDRRLTKDWDDEIKNGFILPQPTFRADVLNVMSVTREILHEDR